MSQVYSRITPHLFISYTDDCIDAAFCTSAELTFISFTPNLPSNLLGSFQTPLAFLKSPSQEPPLMSTTINLLLQLPIKYFHPVPHKDAIPFCFLHLRRLSLRDEAVITTQNVLFQEMQLFPHPPLPQISKPSLMFPIPCASALTPPAPRPFSLPPSTSIRLFFDISTSYIMILLLVISSPSHLLSGGTTFSVTPWFAHHFPSKPLPPQALLPAIISISPILIPLP